MTRLEEIKERVRRDGRYLPAHIISNLTIGEGNYLIEQLEKAIAMAKFYGDDNYPGTPEKAHEFLKELDEN